MTALILAAVLLAVGVPMFGLADRDATELDVKAAQAGVAQVLADPINGYGRDGVTGVRCNRGVNPTVRKGASFTCEVDINGARRQVTAVFSDNTGTYAVDRPR